MKKITHITMSSSYGGAETVILSIIKSMRGKFKFEYLSPKGSIEKILKKNNIQFQCFDKKSVKQHIKSIDTGIIHSHDFTASVFAAMYKRRNIKVISHIHTDHKWLKKISLKSILYLIASLKFKKIIIVSKSMAKEMWFYKLIKNKTEIIINPIDKNEILKLSKDYELNNRYDLIFLGRLSEYKNPLEFIDIVSDIKKNNKNIRAVIVGDGDLMQAVKKKIIELRLENNIELIGFLENPFPYLKNSKLLIMPSKVEALGLSAGQAMILGIPVIASNVGGLKDFINNNNSKRCNEKKEFVKTIEKILIDKEAYKNLSVEAKKINEYFCAEKYMKKINEIYLK